MTEHQQDILVGFLFISGTLSFVLGAFIITVILLAGVAFFSTSRPRPCPVES